ncbi:Solute carrier family 12 member 2 [Gossypium arboreum]|uniref:Solute carrier family 12 member 2 n=1 Tax=Gossypium arboreum TaxID=29729 RepID=A0A0B0NRB3_GOSAR|nr:Solute carrier family 12 member 2 [Gossypium arboreum]
MLQFTIADLVAQLNEKSFELEVKAVDNREEQHNQKTDIPTQPMVDKPEKGAKVP